MSIDTEHLKMIQGVINRMAQASFVLKGWAITITIAGLVYAVNIGTEWSGLIALFPATLFWGLDTYYLRQERLFRCLYNKICDEKMSEGIKPFSMQTDICEDEVGSWFKILWRPTEVLFYIPMILILLAVYLVLKG